MKRAAGERLLKTGEVARRTGVSPDTVRHYERAGLLPRARRASNGYRGYPPEACERVLLVRRALLLGFTLAELSRLLRARDGGGVPCREVRALAQSKLHALDVRLVELAEARDRLRGVLEDWDARLARTPAGARAGLLDALVRTLSLSDAASVVEGRMPRRRQ